MKSATICPQGCCFFQTEQLKSKQNKQHIPTCLYMSTSVTCELYLSPESDSVFIGTTPHTQSYTRLELNFPSMQFTSNMSFCTLLIPCCRPCGLRMPSFCWPHPGCSAWHHGIPWAYRQLCSAASLSVRHNYNHTNTYLGARKPLKLIHFTVYISTVYLLLTSLSLPSPCCHQES